MAITVAFQPYTKPAISEFLKLNCAVLPQAIYEGGEVLVAPGRALQVLPFKAKSVEGLYISSDAPYIVDVSAAYIGDYYLVLTAQAWTFTSSTPAHLAEFRIVSVASWPTYIDKQYSIIFAKFTALQNGVPINPTDIDGTVAIKLDLFSNSAQKIYSGTGTFNSSNIINHNFGTANYRVCITPSEYPIAGLGDIWYTKNSTSFTVFCDNPEATSAFDWIATIADTGVGKLNCGYSYALATTTPTGPSLLDPVMTCLNFVPIGLDLTTSPWLENIGIYLTNDAWAIKTSEVTPVPVRWQLLDKSTNSDIVFYDLVLTGSYTQDLGEDLHFNYEAFLIPLAASAALPQVLTKNTGSVVVTGNGSYRLVIVKNASNYLRQTITNSQVFNFYHGLNSKTYVPLFNVNSGAPTTYRVELEENEMTFYFDQVTNISWLIL